MPGVTQGGHWVTNLEIIGATRQRKGGSKNLTLGYLGVFCELVFYFSFESRNSSCDVADVIRVCRSYFSMHLREE